MGIREFFSFQTLKQKKEEQQQYNAWAFPYGQQQCQQVNALILEMMPDEKKTGMAVYLMGREAYQKSARKENVCRVLGEYLPGKHKRKMYRFLALILADARVDENLQYPTAEELLQQAKDLEGAV